MRLFATSNILKGIRENSIRIYEGTSAVISKNNITSAAKVGIYVRSNQKSAVTSNTVTAVSYAIQAIGSSEVKTTATITGNKVKTTKKNGYDIYLSSYCAKCIVNNNIYGSKGISAVKGVTYTAKFNAPRCSAPKIKKVKNVKKGAKITWGSVTHSKILYRIYRKTSKTKWVKIGNTSATSFTDKKAVRGKKYWYTVRCFTLDGKTSLSTYDTTGKSIVIK